MQGAFDLVPDYEDDEEGVEQSLFIRLVLHFKRLRPEPEEIEPLLKVRKLILNSSVFWLQDRDLLQLGTQLGAEVSRWDLARSACRDLIADKDAQRHLCGSLRYCLTCLRHGWHSSMFQHWALPICPMHGIELRNGCPSCGEEIIASLVVIARAQMTCDSCGCVFERDADARAGRNASAQLPTSAFTAYRQALPQRFARGEEGDRRLLAISDPRTSADVRGRALQRFQVWPDQPLQGYRKWPMIACEYAREPLEPHSVHLTLVEIEIATTLQEIAAMLQGENCLDDCPNPLRNGSETGARLDGSISLVAAAYWKTARLFRLSEYLASNASSPLPRLGHYGYACFASPDVWRATLRSEVLGLMAVTLLELRRYCFLIEVDWDRHAPTEAFLPAWRLFQERSKLELHLRPKASVDTLRRLVRRYAARRLLEVPKDQALLAKLVELDRKKAGAGVRADSARDATAP